MILTGTVQSGENNFSFWLSKLEPYYTAKTGMKLFHGSLNVHLDQIYELPPETLCLRKEEYGGEVSVRIMPCRIFGRKAFILRPYRCRQKYGMRSFGARRRDSGWAIDCGQLDYRIRTAKRDQIRPVPGPHGLLARRGAPLAGQLFESFPLTRRLIIGRQRQRNRAIFRAPLQLATLPPAAEQFDAERAVPHIQAMLASTAGEADRAIHH